MHHLLPRCTYIIALTLLLVFIQTFLTTRG